MDVYRFSQFKGFLNSCLEVAPRLCIRFLEQGACPGESSPGRIGVASSAWISNRHGQVLQDAFGSRCKSALRGCFGRSWEIDVIHLLELSPLHAPVHQRMVHWSIAGRGVG